MEHLKKSKGLKTREMKRYLISRIFLAIMNLVLYEV